MKVSKTALIAIVDDDDMVLDCLAALLKSLGYLTCTFGSAEDFLKSPFLKVATCLISDMRMPGMTGEDLQERLLADGPRIPIIFITGDTNAQQRTRVMHAGAIDVLTKPFLKQDLLACLARVISTA
jgi:FixJ family two-component response regulator